MFLASLFGFTSIRRFAKVDYAWIQYPLLLSLLAVSIVETAIVPYVNRFHWASVTLFYVWGVLYGVLLSTWLLVIKAKGAKTPVRTLPVSFYIKLGAHLVFVTFALVYVFTNTMDVFTIWQDKTKTCFMSWGVWLILLILWEVISLESTLKLVNVQVAGYVLAAHVMLFAGLVLINAIPGLKVSLVNEIHVLLLKCLIVISFMVFI